MSGVLVDIAEVFVAHVVHVAVLSLLFISGLAQI
jgi:hypothetical protein